MSNKQQIAPYPLRMPEKMREALKNAAHNNGRSLNAEIVARLDMTMIADGKGSAVGDSDTREFMTEVVMKAFDEWYDRAMNDGRKNGLEEIINKKGGEKTD